MAPEREETSALVRRLPGVRELDLELVATEMVTPTMRRLRFTADGLAELDPFPGQDLMVSVPASGGARFRRRYTIRRLERAAAAVEMDIVLHGDGPGARWAREVRPGDRVEAVGPRGKIPAAAGATWHLFCGDESALPAIFTMVEALPARDRAQVVIEVGGPEDHQEPRDVRAELDLRWVHRGGEAGTGSALHDVVGELDLDPGVSRGGVVAGAGRDRQMLHAYVFGELRQVAAIRSLLLERGLAPEQVDHKAYWRRGVANAAHGEPERDLEAARPPSRRARSSDGGASAR